MEYYVHCPWCETYLGLKLSHSQANDDRFMSETKAPLCPDCGLRFEIINCHHFLDIKRAPTDGNRFPVFLLENENK